jgi:CheY-like chemotaxis protein
MATCARSSAYLPTLERDQQRAQEAGFNILLPKPVTLPVLHTVLLRFSLAVSMQRLPVYVNAACLPCLMAIRC